MESLYNDFKDIAEFRLVYIREAHAVDGDRPNSVSRSLGINEHTNFEERCDTAKRLVEDKLLTIPTLIDDMENSVDTAYSAKPDRIFLIRRDGRLAIAGERGPSGFAPALKDCENWLLGYSVTGEEPEFSEKELQIAAARESPKKPAAESAPDPEPKSTPK